MTIAAHGLVLIGALLVHVTAETPFCPLVEIPSGSGSYSIVFVQELLKDHASVALPDEFRGAYHTALVFLGATNYTLEFRAQDFVHAIIPRLRSYPPSGRLDLDWSGSTAGFCLTEGLLHKQDYWKVWQPLGQATDEQLIELMRELRPWRVENAYSYQMFRVEDEVGGHPLDDLTCGQGIVFAVNYLNESLGLRLDSVPKAGALVVTTINLLVSSFEEAGPEDDAAIARFYTQGTLANILDDSSDVKFMRVSTAGGEQYYKFTPRYPTVRVIYGSRWDWRSAFPDRELWGPRENDVAVRAETGCRVLAGTMGKTVQIVLFMCVSASLVFKFHRNHGGRSLSEFALDSSKQLIGAAWIHVLNIVFAQRLESYFEGQGDECEWYWINIVVDCTLGVVVVYLLLKLITACMQSMLPKQADDFKTGEYKNIDGSVDPPRYMKQLGVWLAVVSLMKCSMVVVMAFASSMLLAVSQAVLAPFGGSATGKLLVVMVFTPFFMNLLQFWVTDNIIKKKLGESTSFLDDTELEGSMRTRIDHGDL